MRRLPIAFLAALAVGIILGYVLGGVGPRRELIETEREVRLLEEALADGESGSGLRSPVPGLDQILRPPTPGDERWLPHEPRLDEGRGDGDDAIRSQADAGSGRSRDSEEAPDDDPLEAFRRAASVQRVRNVQSRAALEQQARLDDEELAEVDAAVAEMNEALLGYGEELILLAMDGERPPPRELLGITHDVTGILHRAQLRLEDVVGPERMQDVEPSALEVWNHVDLAQLEPAARAAAGRAR